jgi:hypothetical protein
MREWNGAAGRIVLMAAGAAALLGLQGCGPAKGGGETAQLSPA